MPAGAHAVRAAFCCALLILLATVPASAAPERVRLSAARPTQIVFDVDIPPAQLVPLPAEAGDAPTTLLSVDGYDPDGTPGGPMLPARIVTVAVPPAGDVRVSAVGIGEASHEGVLLAPVPMVARADGRLGGTASTPRYLRTAAAYAGRGALAPARATLLDVSWMRDQRVARIKLVASDYEPGTRRLRTYTGMQVTVDVAFQGESAEPVAAEPGFESVYRDLLVNYEQGRAWRRPGDRGRLGSRLAPAAVQVDPIVPETSVYAGHRWLKIPVRQSGLYRVEFGDVRNSELFGGNTSVSIDSLRLFTWPGVPVLPEVNYCDSCDYREVAIQFAEDGNRLFDDNQDYFYFYGLGPSDWANKYDPSQPETSFVNNPYETTNYYYLSIGTVTDPIGGTPRRIPSVDDVVDPTGAVTPATFDERVHKEVDAEYFPDASPLATFPPRGATWEKFFWHSFAENDPPFRQDVDAPGVDPTQSWRFRLRAWGLTSTFHAIDARVNSGGPDEVQLGVRTVEGPFVVPVTYDSIIPPSQPLRASGNTVDIWAPPLFPNFSDRSALAWFDVFYPRRFVPVSDSLLEFVSPSGGGHWKFQIGPFSNATGLRTFDVTDAYAPIEIHPTVTPVGGQVQLSFVTQEVERHRYVVTRDGGLTRVPSSDLAMAPATSLLNLRSRALGARYLVVYYDGFQVAAESLATWRQSHLPIDSVSAPYPTETVPVSALYDQFSGGRTDPTAIRNFMRAVYYHWSPRPIFVTFLGDASYDFKNIKGLAKPGQPGALLPSYENGFDSVTGRQFDTDDWLLNVDNALSIIPDFLGGRLPVNDAASAMAVVRSKVLLYERAAPTGEWRNRVMLIGDDNMQADKPDPLDWRHMQQTSALDTLATPEHIDRRYVYLHTYPTTTSFTKPAAKADIIGGINDGVVMFNYIGHGSPFKIADESVLIDSDVPSLVNSPRLSTFVAASCDVGRFNDPAVQSLGEELLTSTAGGCVAVISATEIALSGLNAELNKTLYRQIFDRSGGGTYHSTLSASLLVGKSGVVNNQKYQVMGDAATRLALPKRWAEVTLEDSSGAALTTLARGQTVRFRGRILEGPGGPLASLNGTAGLLIEDAAPLEVTPDCSDLYGSCARFYFRAGAIYRGDVAVSGGTFTGRFIVPLEAREGPRGRVRAYVEGQLAAEGYTSDAVGSIHPDIIAGSGVVGDADGPRISLSFAGGSTAVRPDADLHVDLFDQSGILITDHSPQNGIIVTVDDNSATRIDITSSFRYAADSYQSGTATFTLPKLSPGSHTIKVSAADNLAAGLAAGAHRSSATIAFDVVDSPPLNVARAYLFPNPTSSGGSRAGGQFVIDVPGDSVNVLLRLYTATGKLIRTLGSFGSLGQVQIAWDGRDEEGDRLANGVYFFRVHVNVRDADGSSSPRQKAISEGRFVILNR